MRARWVGLSCGLVGVVVVAACGNTEAEAPAAGDAGASTDADTALPEASPATDAPSSNDGAANGCPIASTSTSITPSAAGATCAPGDVTIETLTYTTTPTTLALDLIRPKVEGKVLPLVIWIHGGGWRNGSRTNAEQARWLACNGHAVASIDYRLSDVAPFPAQIQDVKAAIRFLRANAVAKRLDPTRFATFGSSAGGHLAALAGTSGKVAALEDLEQGNPTVASDVQAAIVWYGPSVLDKMDEDTAASSVCKAPGRHGEADSPESLFLGCTVSEPACANAAAAASPLTYADASDPPFIVFHGSDDCTVPPRQGERLRDALDATTKCVAHRTVVGAAHGGPEWSTAEPRAEVLAFLSKVFP